MENINKQFVQVHGSLDIYINGIYINTPDDFAQTVNSHVEQLEEALADAKAKIAELEAKLDHVVDTPAVARFLLSPSIESRSGSLMFVNPGTGSVNGATEKQASANMDVYLDDCKLEGASRERTVENDYGDGRYSFAVTYQGKTIDVQMPGWSLEKVRYIADEDQKIWDFPRLYVDGSSWVWKFAINNLVGRMTDKD